MKKLISVVTVLFFLLFAGAVFAQTPDGMTPSEETVCDFLHDPAYTPGLFGLCNAYCEAQDCDLYGALPQSCQRLLANYYRKATGPDDPDIPCEASCPCWDGVDFGALVGDPDCSTPGSAVFADGQSFVLTAEGCIYTDETGATTLGENLTDAEEGACLADIDFLCTD